MKSIKLVSLVGLCIGLFNGNGMAEDPVIITQPFAVDLDNVNTNYYGGAYTILGLRVMSGTNTVATGYAASAGGEGALAPHDNTFVWSDGTLFGSTLPYQFSAFASNGFRLLGGPISGDGSGLSNLNVVASLPSGSITSDKLAPSTVLATHLAPDSVGAFALASSAVTATKLATNSVTSAAIASGAVTSAKLAANSVTSTAIANGAVGSSKLANNSVGSAAIASGAVTSAKLAANSVTASALASNTVTSVKIQDGSIIDADIATNAAISLSKVAGISELTNSVSEHITSIANPHQVDAKQVGALSTKGGIIRGNTEVQLQVFDNYGNGRIGLTDTETGYYGQGVGSESMMYPYQNPASGYLYRWVNIGGGPWKLYDEGNFKAGTDYLPANAIVVHNADTLAHEQVLATKTDYSAATNIAQFVLLTMGVQTNHTGDVTINGILSVKGFFGDGSGLTNLNLSTATPGTITSDKMAAGAVTATTLAPNSVGATAIASGAVTSAKLASNSVGSSAIASGAVTSAKLAANSVGSSAIAASAVTSAKLAPGSVTTAALAIGSVTATNLAVNSVTMSAINSNAVTSVKLADGAVTTSKIAVGSIGTNQAIMSEWNAWGNSRYMVSAGNTDLVLGEPARLVGGQGVSLANISIYAYGASQLGLNGNTQTIGTWAEGASQVGENWGVQTIEESAFGALQRGYNDNIQTVGYWGIGASQVGANCGHQLIGTESFGASQNGYNVGTQTIGSNAYGAEQRGYVDYDAAATNNGIGSIQLLNLSAPQKALITGHASIGLGACTVTNDQSIVAGDGLVSHGNGTVTARGFYGDGSGLTNLPLGATLTANSVTTEKISEGAVTGGKIALGVVNSEHLADGSVTVAKLSMDDSLNMDMNRVTNLGNPVNDGDAVTKAYLRQVLSALPPQGDLSMGSFTNGAPASFPLSF